MSERITQELRDAMERHLTSGGAFVMRLEEEGFDNLCDSIDSIHANLERENDRLKCELDRVLGELDDMQKTDGISDNTSGFMQNAEHHAWAPESHYVMLPKDADGEPIHIGDVVEWSDGSTCEVVGIGDGGTLYYMDEMEGTIGWTNADGKRHHRPDSCERIIKDALTMPIHSKADVTVRLPKDADGECIRVGDKMDGYGKTIEVVELRYGRSGWVLISRDGNGYADTFAFTHHAPTVEDVLYESLKHFGAVEERTPEVEEWLHEQAAKLRLAGSDAE